MIFSAKQEDRVINSSEGRDTSGKESRRASESNPFDTLPRIFIAACLEYS